MAAIRLKRDLKIYAKAAIPYSMKTRDIYGGGETKYKGQKAFM